MIVGLEVQLADISAALTQWTGIEWFTRWATTVGIAFIACVLLFREGVIGRLTALLQRFGPSTPPVRPLAGAPRPTAPGPRLTPAGDAGWVATRSARRL